METLEFLKNEANENEGLGDAGIETFKNAPYASAAKEAGQNSRDAMTKKPVRLAFNLHELQLDQIPCIDELKKTVRRQNLLDRSGSSLREYLAHQLS